MAVASDSYLLGSCIDISAFLLRLSSVMSPSLDSHLPHLEQHDLLVWEFKLCGYSNEVKKTEHSSNLIANKDPRLYRKGALSTS
jgi:hypothetical protein